MKGAGQIEYDFFNFLRDDLNKLINGSTYLMGTRPVDSKKEDAVVTYKAGLNGQFQLGEVMIQIYVPDKSLQRRLVKNTPRCMDLEIEVSKLCSKLTNGEYLVKMINIPETIQEEAIDQHYVLVRLQFKRNNI